MAQQVFSSLRARLLVSVAIAALPVLRLAVYTDLEHRQQAMEQVQMRILQMARAIARDQQQSIERCCG